MRPSHDKLLEVSNLKISFRTDEGLVQAVDGVDFSVAHGKTLGIVGESGSGKSVSTKAIVRLNAKNAVIDPESSITYRRTDGSAVDVLKLNPRGRAIRDLRGGDISMIFQEPMSSFSPVYTVGNQIMEAVLLHRKVGKREARAIAVDMLDKVGISDPHKRIDQYPFELSGGMRQRAMIAVALSTNPSLLIADEPTTALDVTIQAQILELIKGLQEELGMAVIFITHDLGVISQVADEIAVMYLGRIMEQGKKREIIKTPQHPYTEKLLKAIPKPDTIGQRLTAIEGDIPSPLNRPLGCPFHTRCDQKIPGVCDQRLPASTELGSDHTVHCFLHEAG
ncbi:MAG: ABC transporter ATP-binding protein [Trueperaceae bacterium]|nr:MAG: ABC transporter ATP-binding protein [Trueperaceae bacterium]